MITLRFILYHMLLTGICFFLNVEKQICSTIDYKKDSTTIKDLLNTAQDNSTKDFQGALSKAKTALSLSENLLDNKLLFFAYRTLGIIYEENNHLTEARNCYEKALALQQQVSESSKLDIYLDWAIINKKLLKYEITREYYKYALNLAKQTRDMEIVEYVYAGLGTFFGSVGESDKAIEYHLQAKEVAEKRNHTEGVILAHVNMSTIYLQTKNYKFAYSSLQKGHDLAVSTPDSIRFDYVLNAYGKVLNAEKKYTKAIKYHQKALTYCEKTGDKWMIASSLSFIADVYTNLSQYKEAESAFKRCFEYQDYFDFHEQPNLYLSLGNLYLKTNRSKEATQAFYKGLEMSTQRGFKDLILKSNLGLADVYEKNGNYNASLKHILMAEFYEDSIFNEDKSRKIAEVQYKYNTEKSEIDYKINLEKNANEIQSLQLMQNRIILYLISVVLFVVIASIFIFYFIRQKNRNNTLLTQKNKEIELQNERLEKSNAVLKQFAYASAHDLKEPLRSISNFVAIINKRYAQLLPPEASEYMNFVINGVKRMESLISALLEYSTVASDLEEVKEFTSITQALEDSKVKLQSIIAVKNAVIQIDRHFPKIKISRSHLKQIFQNVINNAIKFNEKTPLVQITGKIEGGHYIVEIKDNGIGMKMEYSDKIFRLFQRLSRSAQYEGTGIGLAICKQIVDKYEGTIRFESVEGVGTTFFISFPLHLIEIANIAAIEPLKVDKKYTLSQV